MPTPIYILHIISNTRDHLHQKTFSMCINEFMDAALGHFEKGRFVPDEMIEDIIYHREFLEAGYWPPGIIVDLVKWMEDKNLWASWMGEFDTFAIFKRYLDDDNIGGSNF